MWTRTGKGGLGLEKVDLDKKTWIRTKKGGLGQENVD